MPLTAKEMAIELANAKAAAAARGQSYSPYGNQGQIVEDPGQLTGANVIKYQDAQTLGGTPDYRASVAGADPNAAPLAQPYGAADAALDVFGMTPLGAAGSYLTAGLTGKRYGMAKLVGGVADAAGIDTSHGVLSSDPSHALNAPQTQSGSLAPQSLATASGPLVTAGDGPGSKDPEVDLASKFLPRGGGMSVIPAHEVRRQGPEYERMANQYLSDKGGAAGAMTDANLQVVEAQKQAARERAAIEQQAAQERQHREASKKTIIDQHLGDQESLMQQVRNYDFDPEGKYYGDGAGGAFKRVASMIAVGLGGFAAGLKGGPNQAYEMIKDGIENEYKRQVGELGKLKGSLEDSRSLLAQKRMQFGDEDVAAAAFKADLLGAAQARAEEQMANAGSDIERAKLKGTIAELEGERTNLHKDVFGWQGPQLSGGDPRIQRFEKLSDQILLASKGVLSPTQARNQAFAQVFGVGGGQALPYGQKSGGGGRQQALIARDAMLSTIKEELMQEIALTKRGAPSGYEQSVKGANDSEARLAALPGAMASAIDGSSSDTKVALYEHMLPGPVGYGGAWASTGRLARLNTALKLVDSAQGNIQTSIAKFAKGPQQDDGSPEGGTSEDVSSFTPDQ